MHTHGALFGLLRVADAAFYGYRAIPHAYQRHTVDCYRRLITAANTGYSATRQSIRITTAFREKSIHFDDEYAIYCRMLSPI